MLQRIVQAVSVGAIPAIILIILAYGAIKKVKVYESFVEGAKGAFQVALRIIPFLVAILVAVGMLRAAGAIEMLSRLLGPALQKIGFPIEILPLAIMRPLSGGGSMGIVSELIKTHGPDSFLGRLAASLYGSTETTFYVLAVYFGSVQIKNTRHAVPAGLIADVFGMLGAVLICRILFGA